MEITLADIEKFEKFAQDYVLPNGIMLNKATTIGNTEKFFESHIITLKGGTAKWIKMLHYERLVKAIEIIKSQGLVRKDGEQGNDNSLDGNAPVDMDSSLKPNTDFDTEIKPEQKRVIPEPNRIVEKEIPKDSPDSTQASLF